VALLHQERLEGVHPDLVSAIQVWAALPYDVLILNGVRTDTQQAALYAEGRTATGNVVTNASTAASSAHGRKLFPEGPFGCAIDAIPCVGGKALWQDTDKLQAMAYMVEAGKVTWGGSWQSLKDYDHFELSYWRTLEPVSDGDSPSVALEG